MWVFVSSGRSTQTEYYSFGFIVHLSWAVASFVCVQNALCLMPKLYFLHMWLWFELGQLLGSIGPLDEAWQSDPQTVPSGCLRQDPAICAERSLSSHVSSHFMGTDFFRVPLMETLHRCKLVFSCLFLGVPTSWELSSSEFPWWKLFIVASSGFVIHRSSWLYLCSLEILEQTTLVPYGICHYQNLKRGESLIRCLEPEVPTTSQQFPPFWWWQTHHKNASISMNDMLMSS